MWQSRWRAPPAWTRERVVARTHGVPAGSLHAASAGFLLDRLRTLHARV